MRTDPIPAEPYGQLLDQDIQPVLASLGEYSKRLESLQEEDIASNNRLGAQAVAFILLVAGILAVGVFNPLRLSFEYLVGLVIVLVMVLLVLLLVVSFRYSEKRRALRYEIDSTRAKVEILVRALSQYNERGSLGFAERVALDLRLTEAESALRRVTPASIVRAKSP
jgi:hypothetical protein